MTPTDIADLIVKLRELHHRDFVRWVAAEPDVETAEAYMEMGFLLDQYYFATVSKK